MNIIRFSALVAMAFADMLSFNRARNSIATHVDRDTMKRIGSYDTGFGSVRILSYPNEKRDMKRFQRQLFKNHHRQ